MLNAGSLTFEQGCACHWAERRVSRRPRWYDRRRPAVGARRWPHHLQLISASSIGSTATIALARFDSDLRRDGRWRHSQPIRLGSCFAGPLTTRHIRLSVDSMSRRRFMDMGCSLGGLSLPAAGSGTSHARSHLESGRRSRSTASKRPAETASGDPPRMARRCDRSPSRQQSDRPDRVRCSETSLRRSRGPRSGHDRPPPSVPALALALLTPAPPLARALGRLEARLGVGQRSDTRLGHLARHHAVDCLESLSAYRPIARSS